jgi:Mg-chelatase subunit ChlD
MVKDPDVTLALLAGLVTATDQRLRALARRLAGRVVLDGARHTTVSRRGVQRMRTVPADRPGSDLDLDRSMDALVEARGERRVPHPADLRAREWGRAATATCLVVDRSGSMAGDRLTAAAVAAAACAWRAPLDNGVLVFSNSVLAVQSIGQRRDTADVVNDLLALRGGGTTDLAAALRAAGEQLRRSRAARKICILLSDCHHNAGDDPLRAAIGLDELIVVGPAEDGDEASRFWRRAGARGELATGPSATIAALGRLAS